MDPKKTYEGMFLLDASASDFEAASEPIRNVLDRNQAEILSIKPWEERRLAYEINHRRRGLYVLTYFKAPPEQIVELERDCQLNEGILRLLVLRRDRITDAEINAETPATTSWRAKAEIAEGKDAVPAGEAKPAEKVETPAGKVTEAPAAKVEATESPAEAEAPVETPAPAESKPEAPAAKVEATEAPAEAEAPVEAPAPAEPEAPVEAEAESKVEAPAGEVTEAPADETGPTDETEPKTE